jgi:hypothetical protein
MTLTKVDLWDGFVGRGICGTGFVGRGFGDLWDLWDVHKSINNYQKQPNKIFIIS